MKNTKRVIKAKNNSGLCGFDPKVHNTPLQRKVARIYRFSRMLSWQAYNDNDEPYT